MKIRYSPRGLTFSFHENEAFRPGVMYRYFIDRVNDEVVIVPDDDGKYKMSRKVSRSGDVKPLVDLRNEEVRAAVSAARYMEVEVMDAKIIVHIIRLSCNAVRDGEVDTASLLEAADEVTFSIDKEALEKDRWALSDMLAAAGLFPDDVRDDISYVFDTVSLFSGAGLFDLPFKQDESFDIRFAVDFDPEACETYRANIGDHILCMDIRELPEEDVPDAEVIIGGPCCQGYSNANRAGNSAQDAEKRLLIDDYIRMVRAKGPMMFAIENVPQFLTKENGRYLERVLSALSPDYNITYSLVRDVDVGGYTTRKRMILIGSVKAMGNVTIPHLVLTETKTAGDALRKVTKEWFNYHDVTKASPRTQRRMAQVRPGHNFRDIPELARLDRHSDTYRRLSYDEPAPTLVNWRKVCMMPPEGNRVLSVAEAAALMGLDRHFRVLGSLNARQQQLGNGVTQAVAAFVKEIIKKALYRHFDHRLVMA